METDFNLDSSSWDIVIKDGDIVFVETKQELCRQAVVVALKTFRGEWFRDINQGTPWLENENNPISLLGKQDKVFFDSTIRRVILDVSYVNSILEYKSVFDKVSGQNQLYITVESDGGPIDITTNI